MKYSEDYVNDFDGFVKVLKEAIKEANYCDFTDEQMRNVWASNFNRWKEKEGHTEAELNEGLELLSEYSYFYQMFWVLSYKCETA